MTSADLTNLEKFITVAFALFGLITSCGTVLGVWAVIKWRVRNIEHVLFDNGQPGLLTKFDRLVAQCAANHGELPL